ncbi:MAG: hypothetical protein GPOALKHO_000063 [Sodalis sp.]|nr:MAG: hypothetical protein GPOALKHO_000063 [Sodalis sp.]
MTYTVDSRPAVSLKSSAEMAEALRSAFNTAAPGEQKSTRARCFLTVISLIHRVINGGCFLAIGGSGPIRSDAPNTEYLTRFCLFTAEYPCSATCDYVP